MQNIIMTELGGLYGNEVIKEMNEIILKDSKFKCKASIIARKKWYGLYKRNKKIYWT